MKSFEAKVKEKCGKFTNGCANHCHIMINAKTTRNAVAEQLFCNKHSHHHFPEGLSECRK